MRSDEIDRLRNAFAATEATAPEPGSCPPAEEIWLAVRGELPARRVGELVDHTLACPACAEEWRLAAAFEEEHLTAGRAGGPMRPMQSLRWWIPALAATVLAGLGVGMWQLSSPGRSGFREGEEAPLRALVADRAPLPRDRFILRWEAVSGAVSYDLSAATESLVPLANAKDLTTTEYQVAPEALAGLPAGTPVYWQITAVLADGRRVGSGKAFRAVVATAGPPR